MSLTPQSPSLPANAPSHIRDTAQLFVSLQQEASNNRWKILAANDFTFSYNAEENSATIVATAVDDNGHSHRFKVVVTAPKDSPNAVISYYFVGESDPERPIRSFLRYVYLETLYEPLPAAILYDDRIEFEAHNDDLFNDFDIIASTIIERLRPLKWFYCPEREFESFADVKDYYFEMLRKLTGYAGKRRWPGIKPNCFALTGNDDTQEQGIRVTYDVDGVWSWDIVVSTDFREDCRHSRVGMNWRPWKQFSENTFKELDNLFATFAKSLPTLESQPPFPPCCVYRYYFHIDDSLDLYSTLLDEIVDNLSRFKFRISEQRAKIADDVSAAKTILEQQLGVQLEVSSEEHEINKRLATGHFIDNLFSALLR
jgi:hypothetical protein